MNPNPCQASSSIPWTKPLPDPTPEMSDSLEFKAIWRCIKDWNAFAIHLNGITHGHVRAILDAIASTKKESNPKDRPWIRAVVRFDLLLRLFEGMQIAPLDLAVDCCCEFEESRRHRLGRDLLELFEHRLPQVSLWLDQASVMYKSEVLPGPPPAALVLPCRELDEMLTRLQISTTITEAPERCFFRYF